MCNEAANSNRREEEDVSKAFAGITKKSVLNLLIGIREFLIQLSAVIVIIYTYYTLLQ